MEVGECGEEKARRISPCRVQLPVLVQTYSQSCDVSATPALTPHRLGKGLASSSPETSCTYGRYMRQSNIFWTNSSGELPANPMRIIYLDERVLGGKLRVRSEQEIETMLNKMMCTEYLNKVFVLRISSSLA